MLDTRRAAVIGCVALQLVLLALVAAPAAAVTVAAGASHTVVIRTTDNTVWAWGLNSDGQLGDNTTTQRKTPIQVSGLSSVVAVAAGAKHNLALTSAGVLYAWGDNYYGQIGNGNNTDQKLPVQVMTGVAQVAAGDNHSIALKTDGTVSVWGADNEGQLADGGTTNRNTPYQVTGLGLVNAIAGGGNHTLVVLAAGGSLKAWGKNTNGQLGDGSTYTRATSPVAVSTVLNATNAAGGYAFSFARLFDGTLYAWGHNSNGQLGFGDTTQRPTPTLLATPTSVVAVATGGYHTVALLSDGSLSAWGYNTYGSVGDGSGTQRTSPVAVPGLSFVVAIGAGQYHSVAVTSTGEVWSWGYNNYSQVGDGTTVNRLAPVQIAEAGFNWKAATPTLGVASGTYYANQTVTIACVTSGATIRYTTDGSDPTGSSTAYSTALSVQESTTLKARAFKTGLADSNVVTGLYTLKVVTPTVSPGTATYATPQTVTITTTTTGATIRYTTDGSDPTEASTPYTGAVSVPTTTTLKAAGFKAGWTTSDTRTATYTMNFGTLAAPSFSPSPANYLDSVTVTIGAASGATIRYTTDGTTPSLTSALYSDPIGLGETTTLKAKAWKVDYTESVVTTGTYTLKVATPLLSLAPGAYPAGTALTLTAATAGATLNYTLDGDDPTEADPSVASGASIVLGNYTLKVRSFKTGCDPSDVVTAAYNVSGQLTAGVVAAGEGFSLALLPDGTPFSWGYNASGRLGDGTTTERWVPGPVSGLTGIVAIAAGSDHGLALDATGIVWSWGANASGQIGNGTTTARSSPAPVPGLTGVVAIAAGEGLSAALRSDGSLWLWGENGYGQIGAGDTTDRLSPVSVLTDVGHVAAGWFHTLAVKTDGSLWSWGYNNVGQLGDGGTTNRSTPAVVPSLSSVVRVAAGQSHSIAQVSTGAVYAWGENGSGQIGDTTTTDRWTPTLVGALAGTLALDGGASHSLAVLSDASVDAWGENANGQVGDGTTTDRTSPTPVIGPSGIVAVAGGDTHSLAMASDTSIWAWGGNANGRLGDGTNINRLSPVKVRDGASWKVGTPRLSPAGGSFTAAQTVTLTVNTPGATIRYTTNGADPTPTDPSIASGGTIAVDVSQTVKAKAWKAEMADSNVAAAVFTLTVATPTLTPAGGTFNVPQTVTITCSVAGATIRYTTNGVDPTPGDPVIASGGTIAVDLTQTVKAKAWKDGWTESAVVSRTYTMAVAAPALSPGSGSYAGNQSVTVTTATPGATLNYTTTGREPTPTDPVIASGSSVLVDRSLTLTVAGHRSGWSPSASTSASYYLLTGTASAPVFDPTPGAFAAPVSVRLSTSTSGAILRYTLDGTEPGSASPVYAGPLTLDADTTVRARAFASDVSPSPIVSGAYTIANPGSVSTPILVPGAARFATSQVVTAISPTPDATVRYTTNGIAPTSTDPPVGAGVLVDRSLVLGARGFKDGLAPSAARAGFYLITGALASGDQHVLALAADGVVWSWGLNNIGQLGNGTTTASSTPAAIPGLADIVAVAAGGSHSLALDETGRVWSWGSNSNGQLGDGSTTNSLTPHLVPGMTGVAAIAAGHADSFAVKVDGSAWSWGENAYGILGDGTTTQRTSPVPIGALSQVVAVSPGRDHTLALRADGQVWSWGNNYYGQLGDGSYQSHYTPALVPGMTGVARMAAGQSFSAVLKTDGQDAGSVWTWGIGSSGQLGYGTPSDSFNAHPGLVLDGVIALDSSRQHTLVLTRDGRVLAWGEGNGQYGRLGDGARVGRFHPVDVAGLHDAVSISAGQYHSVAIHADGGVSTWGYYVPGISSDTPVRVPGLSLVASAWLTQDDDSDRLTAWDEWRHRCDPYRSDTNGDGIADDLAVALGLSCVSLDTDGDGLLNAEEASLGTSVTLADSDGDGVSDGEDCAPLDSSRSVCPADPQDHTPPVITLLEPPNATPLP